MKKILPLLVCSIFIITTLSACTLPATTAPAAPQPQNAAPTSAPPTLAIKTPISTATKVTSFQEILSGTQTALAIIRGGEPEEEMQTPSVEETNEELMGGGVMELQISPVSPLDVTTGTPGASVSTAFANTTQMVTTATAAAPVIYVFQGIPGVPTFGILKVTRDTNVTIQSNEFPVNTKYVVKMGPAYSYALGGTVIGTFDSGKGGTANMTFNIPADLKGSDRIDIRVEFPDGRYANNFFYNLTVN